MRKPLSKIFHKLILELSNKDSVCRVCSFYVEKKAFTHIANLKNKEVPTYTIKFMTLEFFLCHKCGFAYAPSNYYNYTLKPERLVAPQSSLRIGDGQRKGREYFMAMNGLKILGKKSISILIFGAGASKDHIQVRADGRVSECYITDEMNYQKSDFFVSIAHDKKIFDLIIACEVVEHFLSPLEDFNHLFKKLKKNGLIILSTNIRNKIDFSKNAYPFVYGHTSYYTGLSLASIAEYYNSYIDFRSPDMASHGHPNKRYIYFSKSKDTILKEVLHYSSILCPESEISQKRLISTGGVNQDH